MMVAVRSTRHTFGIIEKAQDFTVNNTFRRYEQGNRFLRIEIRPGCGQVQDVQAGNSKRAEGRVADRQSAGHSF